MKYISHSNSEKEDQLLFMQTYVSMNLSVVWAVWITSKHVRTSSVEFSEKIYEI